VSAVRPSIQVDVDIHEQEFGEQVGDECVVRRTSLTREIEGDGMMRALVLMKSHGKVERDETGSLTLSRMETTAGIMMKEGNRRRSSSSIRFADDTDTGTDILVITEEDLADILSDPIYGDVSSPARMMRRVSTPCLLSEEAYAAIPAPIALQRRTRTGKRRSLISSTVQQHLLHGVFGMSVGGAGVMPPRSHSPGLPSTASTDRPARMLLTLRRRKSRNWSIHVDPVALLDYSYNRVVDRFLESCSHWSFSSFSLDTLTGGHALPHILLYLFKKYNLIQHFKLDMLDLLKCFREYEYTYLVYFYSIALLISFHLQFLSFHCLH